MDKTIVALDNMNKEEVRNLLKEYPEIKLVKIGLELYIKYGRDFVLSICKEFKVNLFLDLKLHDIPSTVEKAVYAMKGLPIKFMTVHASGGAQMLSRARAAAKQSLPNCLVLAVTILTSHSEEETNEIWNNSKTSTLLSLLTICMQAQVEGIVCSALDLEDVKRFESNHEYEFTKVTPGIRLEKDPNDDQTRVVTPKRAMALGSDYLVVGRPITKSPEVIRKDLFP